MNDYVEITSYLFHSTIVFDDLQRRVCQTVGDVRRWFSEVQIQRTGKNAYNSTSVHTSVPRCYCSQSGIACYLMCCMLRVL